MKIIIYVFRNSPARDTEFSNKLLCKNDEDRIEKNINNYY